jgi:hypothetical protein
MRYILSVNNSNPRCPAWQSNRFLLLAFLWVCAVLANNSKAHGATPAEVDKALAKGKAFLYSKMKDANWESVPKRVPTAARHETIGGQWGGETALAVYALLAAGEDPNDPKLAPSIKWLKTADMIGVYAISMRCQVWFMLPRTPETRKLAQADRDRLDGGYDSQPHTNGLFLYNYLANKRDLGLIDHSVSQFGVLSMWACAQMGVEVPTAYWSDVEKRWTHDQQDDGGWFYSDRAGGSDHPGEQASMTAAGVATLFITQDYVHADEGVKCKGNIRNDHIDRGLKWMADHTSEWTPNIGYNGFELPGYTLFGVERIGVASGLKYFGTVDWYQYGADWCIKNQSEDGSWNGGSNYPNTAFCMLFLARGRAPILINKIQYDGPWNQRPRDVANFVRWMGNQTERQRDINWQVSNLDITEAELHDAPFLYLSGNKALSLKPEQIDKLKSFAQHGGMLLFNSDCGSEAGAHNPFVASVIALGKKMFPDYEFREIPDNHPIYTSEQFPNRWKHKLALRGLSNGVRELMVLMPGDPAYAWQLQQSNGPGLDFYQPIADLVLYGTDKEPLRVKGQSFLINSDPAITATKTIKLERLKYDRNWNPEPGGWDRLSAILHNQAKVDLKVDTVELNDQPITDYPIAHLTGTTALAFTPGQLQSLKNYVEHGGTLIVDAAGGSSEFVQSVEPLLNKLFPDGLKGPLPPGDPIFSIGFPKTQIHYRHFARSILGSLQTPQVKTIQVGGRTAVYYSRYDLSAGLVGEPVDGIVGYTPDAACEIMSGMVLQATGNHK